MSVSYCPSTGVASLSIQTVEMVLAGMQINPRLVGAYKKLLLQDPCSYCGAPADVQDHIVARRRGGTNEWDNLTGSCTYCNTFKSARSLLGFLGYRRSGLREQIEVLLAERVAWGGIGR